MSSHEIQEVRDSGPPRNYLIQAIHRVVANPFVYDIAQRLAGVRKTQQVMRNLLSDLRLEDASVLDIGGGTGLSRDLLPATARYACLDNDPQKLEGFRAKNPNAMAIEGSATQMPIGTGKYDLAIICAVTHHLTDEEVAAAVDETARVLRPSGHLLFLDALWVPSRVRGRLLWKLDRGSNPRTFEALHAAFTRRFSVVKERRWVVHHAYVGWLLSPLPAAAKGN
jgi:ubiquinone/menaquinone biosynthesis C-methylase UbiE